MPKHRTPSPLTPTQQRDADAAAREARLTPAQRERLAAARERAAAEYAHLFDEDGHLIPRRMRPESDAPSPEDELRDLL